MYALLYLLLNLDTALIYAHIFFYAYREITQRIWPSYSSIPREVVYERYFFCSALLTIYFEENSSASWRFEDRGRELAHLYKDALIFGLL